MRKRIKFTNYLLSGLVIGMTVTMAIAPGKTNNSNLEKLVQQKQKTKLIKGNLKQEKTLDSYIPKESELLELSRILYAEAADQSETNRELIGRVIANRVENTQYPSSIESVIYQPNAFSAIYDDKNKNWNQATGKIPMNAYEKLVFEKCKEDAMDVLTGKKIGIPRENDIVAYHDWSMKKPNTSYWNSLEPIHQEDKLIFYAPKENKNI